MGRKVDVDDLLDAGDVAKLLGLTHRTSVGLYRRRHADFPPPAIELSGGRCLWVRVDVVRWRDQRRARRVSAGGV